jgi:prepilin signal peptidase PulO-like enzyme (type II secretory pathway)
MILVISEIFFFCLFSFVFILNCSNLPLTTFFFLIGSIFGSFINMLTYRLPRRQSIIRPRSHCDQCKISLVWYENIPILSYIILWGKCPKCGYRIPFQYFLVEVISGLFFAIALIMLADPLQFLYIATLGLTLMALFIIDWQHSMLPNGLIAACCVIRILYLLINGINEIPFFLIGGCVITALLWLIRFLATRFFGREALGLGDVKLGFLLGLLLGWQEALLAFFVGCLLATVYALLLILFKKISFKSRIPLGPFLILGTLIIALWGNQLSRGIFLFE